MEYKDFKADFVNRTIAILDDLSNKTDYEVTLLINCLFGLIVIPTEGQYLLTKNQKRKFNEFWIKQLREITSPPETSTNQQLVRCMRNALSHINIETASDGGKISAIKFRDRKNYKSDFHTEIVFPVDKLEEFARSVAEYYSKIC